MNIFLNFPQTWQFPLSLHDFGQFPLSLHDFGQVCGLPVISNYLLRLNQMRNDISVHTVQSTKQTIQFIFDETDNDICFIT